MRGNSHVRCGLGEKPVLTGNAEDRVYLSVSHATLLLQQGEHPKVVSERLGHSSISITMDVYSHVMPNMQRGAADKLSEFLFGASKDS